MRLVFALAAAVSLSGCIMDPGSRYDPHAPAQTSGIESIDPYEVDKIPDTAYEIWKRDKERNEKIAGEEDKDSYPPLFKGQKADLGGVSK